MRAMLAVMASNALAAKDRRDDRPAFERRVRAEKRTGSDRRGA